MVKQASLQGKRLLRYLTADPGRFAGGSAVSEPLGLLAVERERLAAPGLRENWQTGDHSMHHPYQADHGRSPSAPEAASSAPAPGGA